MAQLTASYDSTTTTRNLTTLGPTDWEHYQGNTTRTRMTATPNLLSDWSAIGSITVLGFNGAPRAMTASNPSVNDADGILVTDNSTGGFFTGDGLSWTCPADDGPAKTLTFLGGCYYADAVFTASMTGGGVSTQTLNVSNGGDLMFNATVTFQAASPGQTLTISWVMGATNTYSYSNVSASALALNAPAAATGVGQPSAPAFMMIGPGRFRSPMGIGRIRGTGAAATVLSLTGIGVTGSAGTPVSNIANSQTGSSATASAGTPKSAIAYSTSGSAATASAGTPVSNVAGTPSGSAATSSAGTLVSNIAYAATGSAVTSAAGTLTAALSNALSGSQGTAAAGTAVAAISNALSGTSASSSAGTVLAAIANALSGSGLTGSAGTPVANIGIPATGSGLTASAGTVTIGNNVNIALAGQSMTISAGTPALAIAIPNLSGSALTAAVGAPVANVAYAVTGAGITAASGTPTLTVTIPIAGLGLTVSAGTVEQSGGETAEVTFARKAILFSDDKSIRPAKLQWNRTHDDDN